MVMSSKSESASRKWMKLAVSKDEAGEKMAKQIEIGKALLGRSIPFRENLDDIRREYRKWDSYNIEMLRYLFNDESIAEEYCQMTIVGVPRLGRDALLRERIAAFENEVKEKLSLLETIEERLQIMAEPQYQRSPRIPTRHSEVGKQNIFVVHGRDEAAKQTVARFLEHLDLDPIILHERENRGRTIIEKLEGCSADVGFAVVLLTPDDVGAAKADKNRLKPRARQNVVFELGFFVAALGRGGVCALHKGNVEIPSDYEGVIYIPMDEAGAWKLELAKEIRAAGIDIDPDKLLRVERLRPCPELLAAFSLPRVFVVHYSPTGLWGRLHPAGEEREHRQTADQKWMSRPAK
jgi:predicted nucleotide-binding protein